jgi:hypothetical protein
LTQPFSTAHRWFSLLNPTADFGVPEWSRERTGGSPSDDADFDRLFIDFNAIGPVCSNTTTHPTAEWIAQQITEAFPWDQAPQYLIRDRDASYGHTVTRRLVAMGTGIDQRRPARPGKMDISNS